MDWKGAMEQERAALMRLATLLGALAGLAELAAGRSPAMRGFVLWILRRAEAVARDFVTGGQDTEVASMPVEPAGTRPADAMRLAASLRALARELKRQARLIPSRRGGHGARTRPSFGMMPALRGVAMSVPAASAWPIPLPAPDTS
ncbi:MAG: hypothetical protein JJ913_01465 [Rhizobiaceae bacterium]|nr:hypothetical protein [Rhizobiaceae bacterium]